MTIVYLLRYYPTLTETFVYQEIQALLDKGLNIEIVSMGMREDGRLADNLPDVTVHYVPRAYRFRLHTKLSSGIDFLMQFQRSKDIARYRWLREKLKEISPELLHVHFAGEAAEWAHALSLDIGIPYAVTVHAVDMFRPRPSFNTVLSSAPIRTISQYAMRELKRSNPDARLICIPCAVHIPPTAPSMPLDHLRALFIGRDVPKKGLSILLQAWEGIPSPHQLTVISKTNRTMPRGATSIGFLPHGQISSQFHTHNLLILPAQVADDGDMDGIPVVCMEALANRRPVLSTALSGIPELVNNEVGWLLDHSTVEGVQKTLKGLTAHLADLRNKGEQGPKALIAGGFTIDQQSEALIKWFNNVTVSCQFER